MALFCCLVIYHSYHDPDEPSLNVSLSGTGAEPGGPPDTIDPTVTIVQPTSGDIYSTEQDTINLGGTASDNVGVTSVTWVNDRGGSGTASGTDNWTITEITLPCGEHNIITVTAKDAAGNTGTDTLTIDVKPCEPTGVQYFIPTGE